MPQLALWLGFATIALAIVTFAYFALRARQLGVHPFYFRGRLMIPTGIGVAGIGLVLTALQAARTSGPDGISWPGFSALVIGALLWAIGEHWDRRAKKNVETLQRVVKAAETSHMQKARDGEEPTTPDV